MNILITGSSGFIGRHFLSYFMKADEPSSNSIQCVDIAHPSIPRDCRDFFKSDRVAIDAVRFDLVIHCAAVIGGRIGIEAPGNALAENLSIDADLFTWAEKAKPGRIVYFSSSAAYPKRLQDGTYPTQLHESDINLDEIQSPDEIYGWSKLTGEMLAARANESGIRTHVFRPFSGYGSDQSTDYPFRAFIERAKAGEDPFTIWGDGRQTRDFIHVDDIVGAVMAAIEADIQGPINLGMARPTNFFELATLVLHRTNPNQSIQLDETKPKGVGYRVSDNTKMLGFYKPKVSLEEGIRRALKQ